MPGEFLPPVVTELKADISDFVAKMEAAKKIMSDFGSQRGQTFGPLTRSSDAALRKIVTASRTAGDDAGREFEGGFLARARNMWDTFLAGFKKGGGRNQTGFFGNIMDGIQRLSSGLSAVTNQANMFGAALMGIVGTGGTFIVLGALAGLAAVLSALTAGLAAAGLAVGVFAAIAIPAFRSLSAALTQVNTAQTAYTEASKNLNIALRNSKQNMAAYKTTIAGLDPNLRSAAKLLRDTGLQWSTLTKKQKDALVAIDNNAAALKNMPPAMKAALTALMQQKAAWDSLSGPQKRAVTAVHAFSNAWSKLTTKMTPVVLNVLTGFVKAFTPLIPTLQKFARTASKVFDQFAKDIGKAFKSPEFKQFMSFLGKVAGPALTSLMHSIMNIGKALGGFMNSFGNAKDTVRVFGGTIRVVTDLITAIIKVLTLLAKAALGFARIMIDVSHIVINAWHAIVNSVNSDISHIKSLWNALPGWMKNIGRAIIQGLISGINSLTGGLFNVVSGIASHIAGIFGKVLHIGSPSRVMHWHGQMIGLGLIQGMDSMSRHIAGAANRLASTAIPSSYPNPSVLGPGSGLNGAGGGGQPVNVYIDGRKLFTIMQGRTLKYNVNNNARVSGRVTGAMAPT